MIDPTAKSNSRSTLVQERSRFVPNWYADENDGKYQETQHGISNVVHSFTHETEVKRRSREADETQATLSDTWRKSWSFQIVLLLRSFLLRVDVVNVSSVRKALHRLYFFYPAAVDHGPPRARHRWRFIGVKRAKFNTSAC